MSTWLIPRAELTPEQLRAVELNPGEHRVILGGPGSGKTQILLHRAQFLANHFRCKPERFRVIVYTNVLKHYIESAFPLLDLPSENVLTFDDWCMQWYKANINRRAPWNAASKQPDFGEIRSAVTERLMPMREPLFDFILIDEGQDLEPEVFKLLRVISRHVTVCLDHKQQIYDHRSSESLILDALGIRKRNINLLEGFRCSPYIVKLAAAFIDDTVESEGFVNQARVAPRQKETPLLYYASDEDRRARRYHRPVRRKTPRTGPDCTPNAILRWSRSRFSLIGSA